ncbi:hypothetical protein Bhyg_09113 [Pseudolycoriella hygida]|uniref:Uncharacterized protein n=1 Tax=Pseudolycoriella hygida TaxID=35572 RepID=A0A9Q0N6M1_9DIPT|nr:hypothetical protein Bhyg_09113 [Pseudolycoriella hygida]
MLLNALNLVIVLSLPFCILAANPLVSEGKGEDVVCDTIAKIKQSGIFADDANIMRRIAYAESLFGTHPNTYRSGYNGGIWQVDKIGFEDAKDIQSHPNLGKLWSKIEILLNKQRNNIKWEDLRKPLFSGVFARIRLYLVPSAIPSDINGQAAYWKKYYNSAAGAGTVAGFVNKVNDMNNKFGSTC